MNIPAPLASPLSQTLPGTWQLVSRIDVGVDGVRRPEPALGRTSIALLMYDRSGHFSAQFMRRRGRTADEAANNPSACNNSRAIGGYDAYFGTYAVDDARGVVRQTLHGALSREHVGAVLERAMRVERDRLVVQLDTTDALGAPVTRTLTWRRVRPCKPTPAPEN